MSTKRARGSRRRHAPPDEMPGEVAAQRGWTRARHGVDPVQAKIPTRRVTINLDVDLIAIFKAEALMGAPPYQTAINQALRAFLHQREASERDRAVDVVLMALDDDTVRTKLRSIR